MVSQPSQHPLFLIYVPLQLHCCAVPRSVQESNIYPVQLAVQVYVYLEQNGKLDVQSLLVRHSTHFEPMILLGNVKFVRHQGIELFLQSVSAEHSPQYVWLRYLP